MKDVLKKILKYTLSLALAGALLWVSFRGVEWDDFLTGIKSCRWEWIILSMLAGAFAFWLRGLRWHQLLIPFDKGASRLTTFNGINIGNISNFLFPRIGEFVRCGVIVRHSSISYDKVLGTVVLVSKPFCLFLPLISFNLPYNFIISLFLPNVKLFSVSSFKLI